MKFTIVTPSYQQGDYIARTIESVLGQVCDEVSLEYFILDNCSDDGTERVLANYADDPRVTIVRSPDFGQADAINRGWAMATGDIVAWLNADDVYWPGALKAVAKYFQQDAQLQAIYGEAVYIDREDQVIKSVTNIRDYSRSRLITHDFITQPATFLRRSVIEKTGALSLRYRYVFDWDYWLRVSVNDEFVRVGVLLAGYRVTGENLTTTGKGRRFREMLNLVWRYGGLWGVVKFGSRLLAKRWSKQMEIPEVSV